MPKPLKKPLLLSVSVVSLSFPALGQVQASRAYDFVQSVGVNTHFSYTNSSYYLQSANTISAIKRLGVQHVRDGLAYSWVPPNLYAITASLRSGHPSGAGDARSEGGQSLIRSN